MQQVLIFDYDGVIVDSLPIFMTYFIKACNQHGHPEIATKQEFLQLFNGNMFTQMMKKGMDKKTILKIVYKLKEGLEEHTNEINIFPNMKKVLEQLSKHHRLIISTSNETAVVRNHLKRENINGLFDNIYGSDVEPSKVKKIQIIKNKSHEKKYSYIGDTIGDILEGKQAQVQTIAVSWGWHKKNELLNVKPDHIIDNPAELLSLFTGKS
ncbi:MAG TPA: HAD hydrolase-like protein [Candidatus Thermoplasmatota archaeon]|nr:HAD hydrolase-like protein [Candidatus Thermoplasmatota archaeon]